MNSQIYVMMDAQLSTRLEDSIKKDFSSYTAELEKKAKDERKRYIDLVERPLARSDQGLKKRKTSKDAEPPRGFKSKESKFSSSKGSKSQPKSSGKSAKAEEPVFQAADTEMPLNQGDDLGNTDDQPNKKLSNLERDVNYDLIVALQMFTRRVVILKYVEDLQLGVKSYQNKLNITKPQTFRPDITNMTPYIAYNNPQRIIYLDNFKRNKLMSSDELYKFCDGTLTSIRMVLHDIASRVKDGLLAKKKME
uniref:Uncharacterized protein n=1 Tax=Tanacetum cinerariifolium TaxID=118510 RepID=A0A6L2J4F2_TANCI|nr:hypothetical protein [Tanacetum cinerariifolium]